MKKLWKIWENRDIKLVTAERRRNCLVSNYNTVSKNLLAIEMKKHTVVNKLVNLGLSILELSKTIKYEFWYNYLEPKYGCFIVYIKADDIYKDIAEDVETRFDTSNYELNRPFPKAKTKKSYWITEIWIRWKNNDKICWIKSKNL